MAIVVLVLWLFTAGAGLYLLVTSNLGRARPAATAQAAEPATAPAGSAIASAAATASSASTATPASAAAAPAAQAASAPPPSKRELRRAARERFDPPSLTAAKSAPMMPDLRSLLEFAHPASAIVGLGFWLGFTLVHDRALGWIGFGLVTATACLGLTWFTANARAASRPGSHGGELAPSFSPRMVIVHGGAAAVTVVLAALAALVLGP
jgi:hypothetical protein